MDTVIECSGCGKRYRISPENLGKRGKCTRCGAVIDTTELVPPAPTPAPPAEAPAPPPAPPAQAPPPSAAPTEAQVPPPSAAASPPPAAAGAGLAKNMLANRVVAGRQCPVCEETIELGAPVRNCEHCQLSYHEACWQAHGGCASDGCANAPLPSIEAPPAAPAPPPPVQAAAAPAAAPVAAPAPAPAADRKACPHCGEKIARGAKKCRFCGEYLSAGGARGPARVAASTRSTMAIASMACGIASIVICFIGFILGPVAIGLGIGGRNEINSSGGKVTGIEMAIAGIITGSLGTFIAVVLMIIGTFAE
jgi:hypothetical protein